MYRSPLLLAVGLILLFTSPHQGAELHVSDQIRTAMQDRQYQQAIEAIDRAIQGDDAPKDYLTYLKGRAYHYLEQYDKASETFEQFDATYPDSPWGRRVRLAHAMSLARLRGFQRAEEILRAEAEFLLSADRKDELADIYLEFAKRFFAPTNKHEAPDYAKAAEFFQQALSVGPRPTKQAHILLRLGQCHQELQAWDAAIERFQAYITNHGNENERIEAEFRLAVCQLAKGDHLTARRIWQDLLREHAGEESPRLAESAYHLADTYGLPNPPTREDLDLGIAALRTFVARHPDHELASQAYRRMADTYQVAGRNDDAAKTLNELLANPRYANRNDTSEARYSLGRCYQQQRLFAQAITTWEEFLAKHPSHDKWTEAQRAIVDTEFLIAEDRRLAGKHAEARELWLAFLNKHPLDERAPTILLALGEMNHADKQWQAAIDDWQRLVSKYPGTEPASRAQFMIGATWEGELRDFDKAMSSYRALNWGSHQVLAQRAIARLTEHDFSIRTDSVFRTDETPFLTLHSRNLDKLSVRCYRIDLETYFRKMHLATGIDQLDISLIDPDETFEFSVPNYVPFQHLVSRIPLTPPGSSAEHRGGVLIVTVASDKREATTLVIQSDLEVVVKSSRDEVFVFAQNLRTKTPWPNAQLLISDGANILAEAKTDNNGVFQQSFPELKSANDIRVFAIADHNSASNVIGIDGLPVAQGLVPVGTLFTDRTAYRPGQMVHMRGIVRSVANDTFQIEAGKQYSLNVIDTLNRPVWSEQVTLNEFGTFQTHFALPRASTLGTYRMQLSDKLQQTFEGTFDVLQYKLDNVRVEVDTPRNVYYRGEEIEGTIRLKYYFGAPVVAANVTYALGGQRTYTAVSDERGEVRFRLPTHEFRETQTLPFVVTLPDRGQQTAHAFFIAAQGFGLTLNTKRPVFLAGESFEIGVQARDAEGKPVAREVTVKVLEQTNVRGQLGEVERFSHKVSTDAVTGLAKVTQLVDHGGTFILRAEGTDQFGNPVTGQNTVRISDDRDDTRLRILAEQHTFRMGDTPKIRLHWRDTNALALVTFQGARVLEYRLIELTTGDNILTFPATSTLAPNFDLDVCVMTNPYDESIESSGNATSAPVRHPGRLHTANSPFVVERDLRIEMSREGGNDATPLRPGDPLKIKIKTTNPQGVPVAAELSVAMVTQALIDRFPGPATELRALFQGTTRVSSLRTSSSALFVYQPSTRNINADLLAEQTRLATEVAELAARDAERDELSNLFSADQPLAERYLGRGSETVNQTGTDPMSSRELNGPVSRFATADDGRTAGGRPQLTVLGLLGDAVKPASAAFGKREMIESFSLAENGDSFLGNQLYTNSGGVNLRIDAGQEGREAVLAMGYALGTTRGRGVAVQWDTGTWEYKNTTGFTEDTMKSFLASLGPTGVTLVPASSNDETGYWNPMVVTNDQGEATVEFDMPDDSTSWLLTSRGITKETLAGDASMKLTASRDLSGELKLPMAFTDGDDLQLVATIHNRAINTGVISISLECTIGDRTQRHSKQLDAADSHASGSTDVSLPLSIQLPDGTDHQSNVDAVVTLTITSGDSSHVSRYVVPVVPYGLPIYATASGTSSGDTTAWIEFPSPLPARGAHLSIAIGPNVEHSLLDTLFGSRNACSLQNLQFTSIADTTSSDLMAAVALLELLRDTRAVDSPHMAALDQRVRSSLGSLIAAQNEDGGWSWTQQGESNRFTSARSMWALHLARTHGYVVPIDTTSRGIQYLQKMLTEAAVQDLETKAVLLHALSVVGHDDFPLANRLVRSRASLSIAAVLHLALALHEMDRDPMAIELLATVSEGDLDPVAPRRSNSLSPTPSNHAPAELRALYAVAWQQVQPTNAHIGPLVEWLLANRIGHRWSPDKATGPAMLAACHWFARSRFANEHYQLTVWVNDQQIKQLDITEASHTATIDVPSNVLKANAKQEVRFEMTGRGRFTYECTMEAFVSADQLTNTTNDWRAERRYLAAPLQRDGRDLPRGFDLLEGAFQIFHNGVTQLPVGQRAHIELVLWRDGLASNPSESDLEYLVVTEPIPAGVSVIESSVQGSFERFEISPGAITFFIGNRAHIGSIAYDVYGYLPGDYRAAPAVVRDAYRPSQWFATTPATLKVVSADTKSTDAYRLTPRELFELGSWHFKRNEFAQAAEHLDLLLKDWRIQPSFYQQATMMLLDCRLAVGPSAAVVQHFEVIKEKWPELTIPYDKILKIGAAYHDMGEYERCYLIFRATIESSFLAESRVAGFLQSQTQSLRSIEYMTDLIRQYPPETYVAAATFDLAQQIYALAPQAAASEELRDKKITRVDLLRRSALALDDFLTAYPQDPAADQASFSQASALLELDQYADTIEHCKTAIRRYPASRDLDNFWYTRGYCHFALGQHQEALDVCQTIVDMRLTDPSSGQSVPTAHHFHAIYILGQIYHSLGQAAEAIQKYEQVTEQFADASEAIRYFSRRDIRLPEILHVPPAPTVKTGLTEDPNQTTDRPATTVKLPLEFRNVAQCVIQVYRIDLLKFGLLRRDLQGIATINLAGIRPHFESTIELGDGKDYRDRERELELPLQEEGAYLVVCRGDNLHASGMVLVSSLELDVDEDVATGRVRATIRDTRTEKYVPEVDIKIIGSANDSFMSGKSDLRGVFVASDIRGLSTVIAKASDGQYAFFRGKQTLGPAPTPNEPPTDNGEAGQKASGGAAGNEAENANEVPAAGKDVLRKGINERNSVILRDNYQRQQQLYFNESSGVSVEAVK